jgi:PUA-domain protein
MSQKLRRYTLKSKESKQVLTQASEKLKFNLESMFGSKAAVEVVERDFGDLLLFDGKPVLFRASNAVLPTLVAAEIIARLPKAVVDMGAVRFVCNGADIMAPGIVRYEGTFSKGELVVVVDVTHGKPLALGEALVSSDEAKVTKQGPIIRSKHYVSDKFWNSIKTLSG